ncbi:MAG: N-acetylmuramoyl-L-alanine amidase, family 2, partial [Marmoricola sp.]|nr:N-acetylmuramoyl-L-alanine amidase, family 2 [Marmoricola sp.]
NSYTSEQVPALLRGIYAYHTQSRGWRDIGYNYLVDRFGRIWEGRYGGVGSPVVGAHTLGYNEVSFAMSAIGNYDIAAPPQVVLNAFARLFAWKLSLYNIRADASRVYVKNRWLRGINGHRDVGQTACPGRYLYAKLPDVRVLAQRVQNAAQSGTAPPATPPPSTPPPAPNPDAFTSPTQTPKAPTLQPTIAFPRTLNLAGDSNPDLVLKAPTGVVRVLPLGGQIGLLYGGSTKGPWSGMDQIVAVGDVNGDGRGDVLGRTRSDRTTRVYRGDGAGHVSLPGVGATTVFRYANMITAAGDWNRDGRNDVLMRDTATGWLWMVPGLGTGKFGTPVLLSKSWKSFTATAVAGDLTGDGRPDIVGIHRNGYVYAAASTTTGRLSGFSRRQYVGKTYDAILGGGRSMTADSYGDILLRSSSNGRVILLPGKRGGFGPPLGPFDQSIGMRRLSAGQMVLGAQPDLVGTDASGKHLLVYANNGQTNLRALLPSNLTRADASQVLNVGDWNRDGRGDVITRQSGGDALVLRPGLGNGGFGNGIVMSRGWKSFTNLAAVGDITGDKAPDLVGKSRTGKTTIFPGNGSRSFKAPVVAANYLKSFNQVGTGWWKSQLFPATAFVSSDGSFVPFMGTGAGDLGAYNWVVGPGDVDGDRKNDLVGRDARGTLWLLPGTTNGYGTRRLIATGFSGYSLGG